MESKEQVAEPLEGSHTEHGGHHHEPEHRHGHEHHHGEHGHEHHEHGHHHHEHPICYSVDGERQETREHTRTPRQILVAAGIDPESYYLVHLSGHERTSYKDRPDEPIHLHEHEKFVSVYMSSTPVS